MTLGYIFIVLVVLTYTIFISALIRNNLVYKYRVKILYSNMKLYDLLPSYEEMFNKFWIWNFDKFLPSDIQNGETGV